MSDTDTLQERVSYVYPCTISVKHTAQGNEITVHHAPSPEVAAEVIAETKRRLRLKEQR